MECVCSLLTPQENMQTLTFSKISIYFRLFMDFKHAHTPLWEQDAKIHRRSLMLLFTFPPRSQQGHTGHQRLLSVILI